MRRPASRCHEARVPSARDARVPTRGAQGVRLGAVSEPSGVGSRLMTDPGLPRDEYGWHYQVLFSFEGGRIAAAIAWWEDGRSER